jgi:hypothetical protein
VSALRLRDKFPASSSRPIGVLWRRAKQAVQVGQICDPRRDNVEEPYILSRAYWRTFVWHTNSHLGKNHHKNLHIPQETLSETLTKIEMRCFTKRLQRAYSLYTSSPVTMYKCIIGWSSPMAKCTKTYVTQTNSSTDSLHPAFSRLILCTFRFPQPKYEHGFMTG